ncbi:MAG: TonB-dependent receptor [Wenzhouxiangella sp.]|jgi:outer membrane receptor protein involved in Fe transport|nr:TonB-dependent receptor [Wenzhouxiangella sp.]
MQRFCLAVAILTIVLPGLMPCWALAEQDEGVENPARVGLFVFERGRPIADLTVELREARGSTNVDGAWRAAISPGAGRLEVRDRGLPLLALPLNLEPGESLQLIVTLTGEDRRAMVSMESSHERQAMAREQVTPETPEGVGSGVLTGRVVSSEDGRPVAGARIFVSGTPIEGRTDDQGRYRLDVDAGEYAISVLHSEYATRTVRGVLVSADRETERDFEIPPAGLELAEFVVIEPFIEGSLTAVIDEQRRTASVANILGGEQISRAGDSDVGSALSRVTGLTLVDGQFIYIRGLGERYSSTLVNGANVPSPDPTRKVVPLDLFPTGVIRSILVQKGYSPDMPGDFGGGVVEIRTRGIPEEDFFSIGLSTGFRDGTTFEDGLTYEGGGRDWSGFDDGTRSLPGPVAEVVGGGTKLPPQRSPFTPDGLTPEQLEALGESFANIYDINEKELGPDQGVSIEGGKLLEFGSDWNAGVTGSLLWDDSWRSRSELRRTFIPLGDGSLRSNDDYTIERTTRTIGLSGFLTGGINYKDLHEIDLTWMRLRQTEDETSRQTGFNLDEDGDIRINELEWEERELMTYQVQGSHVFPFLNGTRLEWDYSDSVASLDTPDQRRYRYDPDDVAGLIFSRRADSNIRRYTQLDDTAVDVGADVFVPFSFRGLIDGEVSGGFRVLEKARDSIIRRFTWGGISNLTQEERRRQQLEDILTPDNIGPGGVLLQEVTRNSDTYAAFLDVDAFYGSLDVTIAERFRLSGGARVEDWRQNVRTFSLFEPDTLESESDLADTDLFPAVALTWLISDRQQLRLSYAETIIRPDFKELSDSPFTDPILKREVVGNPDLVSSDVQHADIRWEFYPEPGELVSIGAFYKLIQQPIELTVQPGVSQLLTYANAKEAENFGVEFEGRKTLGFIDRWLGWDAVFDPFYVAGNVSIIESEITINPDDRGILTSTSRELQGQSPMIINFQVGYDRPDLGLEATLLYNFVGERIAEVGVLGAPDKIEQAQGALDFVFRWRWSDHWSFSAKFGNLLDDEFEIKQGPETTQRYGNGRTLGLGLSYDFF